jgi:hypothetical protein
LVASWWLVATVLALVAGTSSASLVPQAILWFLRLFMPFGSPGLRRGFFASVLGSLALAVATCHTVGLLHGVLMPLLYASVLSLLATLLWSDVAVWRGEADSAASPHRGKS